MEKKSNIATRGMKWGAVSLGALIIAAPNLVMAQDAPEAKNSETVVVTGLRGSLSKSINLKKNATSIGEAVSAEDIGKLPDQSIAESIARLPGITGQRVNGDVQLINVRGTPPDFTVTTLNGRMQGTLGDGRGVEVDQYPSELINSVFIYKTPDSALGIQGLAGTVDLRTIRPLNVNGRKINVNARYSTSSMDQLNPDVNKDGYRFSASYINQFMDGKLGVAIGYAHLNSTNQTQHFRAWGYNNYNIAGTDYLLLNGAEVRAQSLHKERDGLLGVVEYKPNDNYHAQLDLYYSKMKQEETIRGVEFLSQWGVDNFSVTSPAIDTIGGTKYIKSGVLTNMRPIVNNKYNTRDDDVLSVGFNQQFKAGIWDLDADLSYSKTKGDWQDLEMFAGYGATVPAYGDGANLTNIAFLVRENGQAILDPSFNYSDASKIYLGDSAPWGGTVNGVVQGGWGADGHIRYPHIDDQYTGFNFKARTSVKDTFVGKLFSNVELGLNFTAHDKTKSIDEYDINLKNNRARVNISPVGIGNANLGFVSWGGLAAFDIMGALNQYYALKGISDNAHWNKQWGLNEEFTTLYAKLDVDSELFGHRLSGNVGVQYSDVRTQSEGYIVGTSSTPTFNSVSNRYDDVLPSLNLALDITKNQKLRFGASKQVARPRPDDLRASVEASLGQILIGPDAGKWRYSGNGGNPNLQPWRANAYDLSWEWYLNKTSAITLAGFYKTVDSYIYTQNSIFDFASVPNPNNLPLVSTLGTFSLPLNGVAAANGKDAFIKGIEVRATIDLGNYVPMLSGFGFDGSYTKSDTNIAPDGPASSNKLPGFSGSTYNITGYYEKNGFQARISKRWREAARSEVGGLFAAKTYVLTLDDEQVDAQIGYTFQSGQFEGLSINLQAFNVDNSPLRTRSTQQTSSGTYLPETYDLYGTQYALSVGWKF